MADNDANGMEPESKRNMTLIIAGAAVVLLFCCCSLFALLWFTGDPILEALDLAAIGWTALG